MRARLRRWCSFTAAAATGPRYRLRAPDETAGRRRCGRWRLAGADGRAFGREIADALRRDPLCFSTSALLRPIVQDTLLPTAAYVGGPAEINYFAQLAPLYDHFGVAPPLVVPRARFRCLDPRTRRLLAELGLRADDVARPRPSSLAPAAAPPPRGDCPTAAALRAAHGRPRSRPRSTQIAAAATALDPATELARAAERTRGAASPTRCERLTGRYARSAGRARRGRARPPRSRCRRAGPRRRPAGARLRLAVAGRRRRPALRSSGWCSTAGRVGPFTTALQDACRAMSGEPVPAPLRIGIACFSTFGGSGVVAAEIAMSLARRGHAVHVFSDEVPGRLDPAQPNVSFHRGRARAAYPQLKHSPYTLALTSKIVEVSRRERLD